MRALLRLLARLPAPLQYGATGGRVTRDGQSMDGPSQILNALAVNQSPPIETTSPAQIRAALAQLKGAGPPLEVSRTEDHPIEGPAGTIRARVYRPDTGDARGALVFFHGGGWVIGDLDGHDYPCSCLAARAGVTVISVEYRLAPEHPYPAAIDDAYAGFQHVRERAVSLGIDAERIAVGGDSAGGNLAAAVALRAARRREPTPAFQLLVYPATDLTRETEAYDTFANGFLLTREHMRWFIDHYVPDPARRSEIDASPLLAGDLSGQPPAHVVIAGFDPLRDESRSYARRLEAAGVAVTVDERPSTFHGFFGFGAILPVADAAVTEAARRVRDAIG